MNIGGITGFLPLKALSVGIIGGADGPTAIFVTGSLWPLVAGAAVIIGIGLMVLIKRKK